MQTFEGLGTSPGVAIGRAICIAGGRQEVYRFPLAEGSEDREIERLHRAVRTAAGELETTRRKAEKQLGRELASIFEAHLLVLEDAAFLGGIEQRIHKEQVNAEWAVHETSEELQARFERFEVQHLRDRSEDIRDVAQHLLRALAGIDHHDLSELPDDGVVIVAEDLIPSEAVRLGRQGVVGFALERAGQTSHTTIIARSLRIPLVGGLKSVTELVTDSDPVVVDGGRGRLILHPTAATLRRYRGVQSEDAKREGELARARSMASQTRDGEAIELLANIELPEEVHDALRYGAAGIGLYRSEFLFIEKSPDLPSEEEHYQTYRHLVEEMAPHPVVVRTFDLGGRKLAREVLETHEENPVMGLRGIRLTLARPEVFRYQLRALWRAGAHGDLRVLLPMVSSIGEVRQFAEVMRDVEAELRRERRRRASSLKLGVMIEVPSAALIADRLAREVDFFSIGTNDLIQYAIAADRSNREVSYLYSPVHPAILRMIRLTIDAALAAGIDVALCGEMAAQPRYAPLLIGLGLRSLSVTPRSVPELKQLLPHIDVPQWRRAAAELLELPTAEEVEARLDRYLAEADVSAEGRTALE